MKFDMFNEQIPMVPIRALHLDLKGVPPTYDRLMEQLDIFAAARFNALLVEWEDMFPWTVDKRFRCKTAYTAEQVTAFADKAESLGLEVIPLVQCLGHMQTPLGLADYAPLREVPHNTGYLNPLAESSRELVQGMIEDALKLTPNVRRFHIGGDEAWLMGRHSQTAAYIEKHGKANLYLHFVEPLLDYLNERGIRPLLWHDMMLEWNDDSLRRLGERADLVVWGYRGNPDTTPEHHNIKHIRNFARNGVKLWGASAFKGTDGSHPDLPNIEKRIENNLGWIEVAARENMEGVIATGWSRYATDCPQCEPTDAVLDMVLLCGIVLHDGKAPARGIDACREAMASADEKRFAPCREATAKLAGLIENVWEQLKNVKYQLTLYRIDTPRYGGAAVEVMRYLLKPMGEIEQASVQFREAFAGIIDSIWIEEYLASRVETLRVEVDAVTTAVKQIDARGYEAEIGKND
jgi:hexosaminidase